jgi:ubiquinone biosynthesis protein COQ9
METDPLEPGAATILEQALDIGERRGWDALQLHDLAASLGCSLADVQRHYDQKDALAEAWFDRADLALLAAAQAPGWTALPQDQRLQRSLWAWLDALAPHRRLTREMLGYKLHPEHLHLQAAGVLRISRTVQWWREAAALPSTGWRRERDEAVLTALFVTLFTSWLFDDSDGAERTRATAARVFALGEATRAWLPG